MDCLTTQAHRAMELLSCAVTLPKGTGQCNPCNALPHCLGAEGSASPAVQRHTREGGGGGSTPAVLGSPSWWEEESCLGVSRCLKTELLQRGVTLLEGSGDCNRCNALPQCLGAVGGGNPVMHCLTALGQQEGEVLQCTATLSNSNGKHNSCNDCLTAWGQWAVQILQYTSTLPGGNGRCNSYDALPHRLGMVGSGNPAMRGATSYESGDTCPRRGHCLTSGTRAMHYHTACGLRVVLLVQSTATRPRGNGQCIPCNIVPHCLGAVGSGTPTMRAPTSRGEGESCPGGSQCLICETLAMRRLTASGQWAHCLKAVGIATGAMHCRSALGQWAVEILSCTASLPWGSRKWKSCNALLHCLTAMGSTTPAMTASQPGGSGQCKSSNTLPRCLGAMGGATPTMHCHTASGWWAVETLLCAGPPAMRAGTPAHDAVTA